MTQPESLRALTIWQPWASACFLPTYPKNVENRNWSTRYRGRLYIHAARKTDLNAPSYAWRPFWASYRTGDLPSGAIIGHVTVTDSRRGDWTPNRWAEDDDDTWHWWFTDPVLLTQPIPCTGRQGLWPLPAGILKQLGEL